jgi:long-chain fatty acid transport protein
MSRSRTLLAAALLAALLFPTRSRAAGYDIYEQGAAALGRAGAVTASVGDPSAVFFNPAAMTRLDGTRFYVGGTALQPRTEFIGQAPNPGLAGSADMVRQTFYPPTFYATHSCEEGWAVGFGFNSPFGLGVEWPADFSGRYLVTKADLNALNASLCLAYAPNEMWSFAAGGDLLWAKVGLKNQVYMDLSGYTSGALGVTHVADADLESDYTPAPGWNAAVLFTPRPEWKVGAYYRSKVIVHVDDGTADFSNLLVTGNGALDGTLAAVLSDQGVSTVLRFPAMWSVGAAWNPRPEWTVEADLNVHEWKVFRDLPIDFENPLTPDKLLREDYDNSWQVRTGAEYRNGDFAYRAGYYFDRSPAPEHAVTPLLPDSDRQGLTVGLGWSLGAEKSWTVDAYELAIFAQPRVGAAPPAPAFTGEYSTFVNAVGLGVGYHW